MPCPHVTEHDQVSQDDQTTKVTSNEQKINNDTSDLIEFDRYNIRSICKILSLTWTRLPVTMM